MIKSICILNFQSHERSILELSEGVNVIIGNSDSGKTAIIRALRFCVWNRPSGNAIRSTWGGPTHVELHTEAGMVIRLKDKQDEYILKLNGQKDIEFKAFGTNVPEEISRFLNISEVNLQSQLDSPFLLSETPGNIAQHFNKVARLDKIDTGTSNVNSAIRTLESGIKYKETDIKTKQEELKLFNYLEKFETELEVLEDMDIKLDFYRKQNRKLSDLVQKITEVKKEIDDNSWVLECESDVNTLLSLYEKQNTLIRERGSLILLLNDIDNINEQIQPISSEIKLEGAVNDLLSLYNDRKTLAERQINLSRLLSGVRRIKSSLDEETTKLGKLEDRFKREFPDICPLCGSIIKHEH